VRDRSAQLSNLSQDLATAQLPSDVFEAIETWVPPIVGATRAVVRPEPDEDDEAEPVGDPATATSIDIGLDVTINRRLQQLHVTWERAVDRSPVVDSVLRTVARLAEAALQRSEVHQHEHELVEQLQIALLGLDEPGGDLDVAVRYEPAVSLLGMGGDFYDTVRSPDADFLVVGDVTGHGPSAVASMAELKTLTRHLLMRGDDLGEVCAQLDALLQREGSFATMAIVGVDRAKGTIRHLSAGHPYALLRTGGEWAAVADGRRSLLGVSPAGRVVPSIHRFESGDAIVLYTDGLVEDRRTPLHESIEHVRAALSSWPTLSAEALADCVVALQTTDRVPSRTDDDIAVLVALCR
jgi:serine phosphatase RsbU (regulator of sigma subunit)